MRFGYARTTVLIGAALAGLATVTLIYLSVFAPWKRPQEAVPVVIAAEYISADTVVSADMLSVTTVPESQLMPGAAARATDVIHKVTTSPVAMGEQFITAELVDKATAFGLAGIIPPGTRAMTITVDAADAVSGFLQPGDHIDVLATFTMGSDSVARTILQNVVLLAVNASLLPATRDVGARSTGDQPQQPEPTTTKVTIAVTPSEAERLVAAQYKGKLKIGLRGLNDESRVATGGASLNAVFGLAGQPGSQAPSVGAASSGGKASVSVSARRLARRRASISPAADYGALPPLTPMLQPEPTKIRVIKGGNVQEVAVER